MHCFDTPSCSFRFKKLIPPHDGDFNVSHHVAESVFSMPSSAFKFFSPDQLPNVVLRSRERTWGFKFEGRHGGGKLARLARVGTARTHVEVAR